MHMLSDFVSGEPPCLGSGGWLIRGPGVACLSGKRSRVAWRGVQKGVAVISRDLTRTYSGRCMECIGLGSAIEQLNRYGAFICEYKK